MGRYVVKRLLQLIPILIGITLLSFGLMYLAGGDAVTQMVENQGVAVSQEIIDAKRHELGLDQPFIVQYFNWLGGMFTGDMGTSYVSGKDVFATFMAKLPATILLALSMTNVRQRLPTETQRSERVTTTISSTQAQRSSASRVWAKTGFPPRSASTLSTPSMRRAEPAAATTAAQ